MRTPWGSSQTINEIMTGIRVVSTASHGGVKLDRTHQRKMPDYMRMKGGWYEEDCEWALPYAVFEREILQCGRDSDRNAIINNLHKETFRNWFPDEYERFYNIKLIPGESFKRDEQTFEQLNKNNWIVISAIRTGNDQVKVTATMGRKRGNGIKKRYFMIPKNEYERPHHFGFVVDPEKYVEVLD